MSAPSPTVVRRRMREAAAWRLQEMLLERPRAGWAEEVESLAREVRDPRLRAAAEAARTATEGDYLAALGPGGAASPREVAYRDREDPSRLISELRAWYEAFAYRPRGEDPPDHVAVETGFVGYLLLKEAMALGAGDGEAAGVAARARKCFMRERLRHFADGLSSRLGPAGDHLALAVGALRERLGSRGPATSGPR